MPKISALPAAASVNLTDILPEVSPATGGTTYKATFQQVLTTFQAAGATGLTGGTTNEIPYQTAVSTTGFMAAGTQYQVLVAGAAGLPGFGSVSLAQSAAVSGILPIANGGTNVSAVSVAPIATHFAGWDANSNLSANSFIEGYATTATAAAISTLTVASPNLQYFTGSTTQSVVLPVVTTLVLGQQFQITNLSSGVVTVQSSGSNTIQAMAANTKLIVTCILTSGTTAASWDAHYTTEAGEGTVTSVAASVPSVLSISGSPITTSGTLAIGYSGTALPVANGGTAATTASITSFNNITGYTAAGATGTTSTNLVFSASPTITGTLTLGDATTPALVTASGKTNTGYLQVNGKTSGALKITAADSAAQTLTLNLAAQTTGAGILNIPDQASATKTVAWLESPTFTTPTLGAATATSINFGGSTLSTYVTGAWTPAITFGTPGTATTYSSQVGNYTQVGNLVTFTAYVVITSLGTGTGNVYLNLPVGTPAANSSFSTLVQNVTFTSPPVVTHIVGLGVVFFSQASTTTTAVLTNTNFANNSNFIISGSYIV